MKRQITNNYGKNKENEKQMCCYCASTQIIKHRRQQSKFNPQRLKCTLCNKTFTKNTEHLLNYCKLSPEQSQLIVKLYCTDYPASLISSIVNCTEKSVRRIVRKSINHFKKMDKLKRTQTNYYPRILEIDEIYIDMQGKSRFYAWVAFDPVNRLMLSFKPGERNNKTQFRLFRDISVYKNKLELLLIDSYPGYKKCINLFLTKNGIPPITGVLQKSQTNKAYKTYELFGRSKKTVERTIKLYKLGNTINTAHIEALNTQIRDLTNGLRRKSRRKLRSLKWIGISLSGFMFYHNYVKPHWALRKRTSKNHIKVPVTPAMAKI